MNQINKKPLPATGIPKPFNRQTGHVPQIKPGVTQLKAGPANGAMNRTPPVAPPVYRPQPTPKVLQRKSSLTQNPQVGPAPRQIVAPPVYRPQAKKIVQPKTISPQRMSPTAPPVYRQQQKRIAQPKMAPAAPAHSNAGSASARIAQLKKKDNRAPVVQLASYQSLLKPGLTVKVDAGARGVYAQATKEGKEYEPSHLQYAVNRYMNATGEGGTVATGVPMATQTETMHSYPEQIGIGTLMLAEAMEYLRSQRIDIFQPDIMKSEGGKLMKSLITGTDLSAGQMEQLITDTDHGGVRSSGGDDGEGCCSSLFSCLFSWCSKPPERQPLVGSAPRVRTYPAIRVNYEATKRTLGQKISEKFELLR